MALPTVAGGAAATQPDSGRSEDRARGDVEPGREGPVVVLDTATVVVEQWVFRELGNSSHIVVDRAGGNALVIDPVRDVDRYLVAHDGHLVASLDTHVHNDFLSGGPDLRALAGAAFVVPAGSDIRGADRELSDGDEVVLGAHRLRAVATPGHTPEHQSYLLLDADDTPLALFSGGALMVGTMARPDLLGASRLFEMSHAGFEAMRDRLMTMPDALRVFPTHGGGSFCGAATSTDRETTIGRERRDNPLATAPDFGSFLAVHARQGRYPSYYSRMAPLNRAARPAERGAACAELSLHEVDAAVAGGAVVVDCRPTADFVAGHVPGSLAVPADGPFSAWVGWVLDIDTPVVLVASSAMSAENASRQLHRVGFTGVRGWIDMVAWSAAERSQRRVAVHTMADVAERALAGGRMTILDARQDAEWDEGHLPGAVHAMAPDVAALVPAIDRSAPVVVHCATGYRAGIVASLLLRTGVSDVWHLSEGVEAWTALGHPLVTPA